MRTCYWYGIHGVEQLFTVMGTGCQSVSRTSNSGTDVVVGIWEDDRIGVFRGIRSGRVGVWWDRFWIQWDGIDRRLSRLQSAG